MKKFTCKRLFPAFLLVALLIVSGFSVFAQGYDVSGTVKSDEGALAGVTIRESGTNNATVTDVNGAFKIQVSNPDAELILSFIGFQTTTVSVNGQHTHNVLLPRISQQLSNVVVTALGIDREKRALGYSIDEVSGEDVNHTPHENVLTALAGKTTGVTINQTGGTGSSVSMVIRGANSLSNDNQPLFVVDGVPIENSLNNVGGAGDRNDVDFGNALASINPEDIKNISILKGPSAAALYGSRAGNGVVMITTRDGSGSDNLQVSVSSSTVFDIPHRYLFTNKQFAAGQFPAIPVNESGNLFTNPFSVLGGLDPNLVDVPMDLGGSGGSELDKGYMAIQWNSPTYIDENGKEVRVPIPLKSYPRNAQNFLQTGITSQNSVSLSNSSKNIRYRLSFSDMRNRGIIPNTDLRRNTVAFNGKIKATDKISVSTSLNLGRNNADNRPAGKRGTNPLYALYRLPTNVNINDLRDYWVPGQKGIMQLSPEVTQWDNPWFLANEVNNGFVRDRLYGNVQIEWKITDHLGIRGRYGLDTYSEQRTTKLPFSYTRDLNGGYFVDNLRPFESNADVLLGYKNSFNDFSLSASFGANTRYEHRFDTHFGTADNTGLVVPEIYNIQNILPENLTYSSRTTRRKVNSIYGMATLGYKDYAYLDLTARSDWSSTLPNAGGFFYPSASLSLLVDDMLGIHSNLINQIKLRGGAAQVGNDATPYRLEASLQSIESWGGVPRWDVPSTLLNPGLKPEKVTSYEGGADLIFWNSRIRLSGTYYQVDDENQILNTSLPSESGYTSRSINAGLVRTKGMEASLGITVINSPDFHYDVTFNFTKEKTWIIRLAEGQRSFGFGSAGHGDVRTAEGELVGNLYGTEVQTVKDKDSPYYGWPILENDDGFPVWSTGNDNVKIGNNNSDFLLGIQNTLSYKNWSLSATLDWRSGGQFVSQTMQYGMENGFSLYELNQFWDPGMMRGKELADYLKAHADELIKIDGNYFPRVGWPTTEFTTFPFEFSGVEIPFGGMIIPGVVREIKNGEPTGNYIENLGENLLGKDPDNPNATYPAPFAVANMPWSFQQATLFPADYLKLRELAVNYRLPEKWTSGLGLQNVSLSVYTRNIILWTKANIDIDPERAYQTSGGGFIKGIESFNLEPWIMPIGFKVNVTF